MLRDVFSTLSRAVKLDRADAAHLLDPWTVGIWEPAVCDFIAAGLVPPSTSLCGAASSIKRQLETNGLLPECLLGAVRARHPKPAFPRGALPFDGRGRFRFIAQ